LQDEIVAIELKYRHAKVILLSWRDVDDAAGRMRFSSHNDTGTSREPDDARRLSAADQGRTATRKGACESRGRRLQARDAKRFYELAYPYDGYPNFWPDAVRAINRDISEVTPKSKRLFDRSGSKPRCCASVCLIARYAELSES
jgi:hypothetical protein